MKISLTVFNKVDEHLWFHFAHFLNHLYIHEEILCSISLCRHSSNFNASLYSSCWIVFINYARCTVCISCFKYMYIKYCALLQLCLTHLCQFFHIWNNIYICYLAYSPNFEIFCPTLFFKREINYLYGCMHYTACIQTLLSIIIFLYLQFFVK